MIQLNCTNCKSLLQIDDAFAGGVCRCRYCGTIQTVPKRLKKTSVGTDSGAAEVEASANGGTSSAKTLFTKKSAIETAGSGTGLDDLAGIVASSGLTGGRLQKKTPPPATPDAPATPWDRRTLILLSSAGGVIALLLIVILIMAFRDRSGGTAAAPSDQGTGQTTAVTGGGPSVPPVAPAANTSPSFLGQAIDAGTVAYVLDRGGYSHESHRLDSLKTALVNSVKSLGPNQRFQVVFWEITGEQPHAYPTEGPRPANAESVNGLQAFLDNQIYPVGTTQEVAALHLALKSKPQAVMFVPIRGLAEEQQTLAARVLRERAGESAQSTKFYCFTLGQTEWAPAMRRISDSTGGAYRDVPLDELNKFANP
jgi:hypothetical protein